MTNYIMRLDDACEKRNMDNWNRMETLLDQYKIKPLVGIIPHCEDPMMNRYAVDEQFWSRVNEWIDKGWEIALHGYNHVYSTSIGGLNPVNRRSEFAGEPIEVQKRKIREGISIMKKHGVVPKVFFAPSHTFDKNTIEALKSEGNIFIISDTIANRPYTKYGVTFVPQQSGRVRKLPFDIVTFCYHPNTMNDNDFEVLEKFLKDIYPDFISFPNTTTKRKESIFDRLLGWLYFVRR